MNIMDYLPLANVLMGNGLMAIVMVWANGGRARGRYARNLTCAFRLRLGRCYDGVE